MTQTYSTERLPLAIFLHATSRLRFTGCKRSQSGRVQFFFLDPSNDGPGIELEYERGASAPASAIFASQKFLRQQMSGLSKIEDPKHGNHQILSTATHN